MTAITLESTELQITIPHTIESDQVAEKRIDPKVLKHISFRKQRQCLRRRDRLSAMLCQLCDFLFAFPSEIVSTLKRKKIAPFWLADQGLRCLLTESMAIIVYIDEQRMSRLDCSDAHIHLDHRCSHWHKGLFHMLRIMF